MTTLPVRTILILLITLWAKTSIAQKNSIIGTYFNTFNDFIGHDNCCRLIEVFRLNQDKTFNYYRKDDQGDYKVESFSYGNYSVVGDSILFVSKTDSSKIDIFRDNYFEYSGFKMKIHKLYLETLNPVGVVAGGKSEKVKYYKATFNDFDSLKVAVDKSDDSLWKQEYLVIKKDRTLKYSFNFTSYKTKKNTSGQNEIILSVTMYNSFLKTLSESPLLEPVRNKTYREDNYVVYLYFKNKSFSNGGNYFSERLYNFLFKELLHR